MPTHPPNQLRVWIEQKVQEGRICSLCWVGTATLSCPWTSVRLVLWCSGSDQDFHHWPPASQAYRLGLNDSTSFPHSPAGRWLFVGLFGLHNQWGNSHKKNLFYLSTYLIGSVSLEYSNTNMCIQFYIFNTLFQIYLIDYNIQYVYIIYIVTYNI